MQLLNWMRTWRRSRRRERRCAEERLLLDRLAQVAGEPGGDWGGRVITVVLGGKPDPLRPQRTLGDFAQYIRPWWSSMHRVGLRGTILHDSLPDEFVETQASPLVNFVRVEPQDWPLYHERHRLIRQHLDRLDDEFVLITDVSDVAFRRNPFEFLRTAGAGRFAIGSEPQTIQQSRFIRQEMDRQFGRVLHPDRPLLNPGILGGRRERVVEVLDAFLEETAARAPDLSGTDMSLFNKAIHDRFCPEDWLTGHPLHSKFRSWEFDTTAAIIHK
ncbi:hypothetical protein [Planctellipticum variicoloris]|uniref:hypothetical protein n=1 Tax=Planctellipticum variicoloris TaxID=3064265 RepID=UPI003013DBB8|nr:hypothetical protein SH412_000518 [Planctomycetaceae bacterium SH412]